MQTNLTPSILIAIDDSAASYRAVTYVAQIIGGGKEFRILLLHVPEPMPPKLLEFGGAENPVEEQRAEMSLKESQIGWTEKVERTAQPIFARAKAILLEAQVPETAVTTHLFIPRTERSLDASILDVAQAEECATIVVGRESFPWLKELFQQHIADKLLEQDHNRTLWIVR
jgi:nucleotide-binding universal stress UspA family protein